VRLCLIALPPPTPHWTAATLRSGLAALEHFVRRCVTPDGLAFRVGHSPDAFRLVRWSAVRHVLPPVGDVLTVYIARVGPVHLPRLLEPVIRLYRGASYG